MEVSRVGLIGLVVTVIALTFLFTVDSCSLIPKRSVEVQSGN